MANSSSSEEENDWLQHSRKRGNGTKRHTRSKSKNCAEQQETKRICRERICKKNALQKIKLISVSDSTHLYPKRNALKAASKNDDSEEDIEFMELWDGTCNNDRLQSPPQSDDDLEVIEVWNDILKSPPQLNEDQQFVQARKNKRKQVLLPPDVYPKVMQARKISCKNGRLQIPPQPDEGPEKTEVTQKSDQDQETLLTHLTSYQYPLTLKIPLKSEAEDLEALQNPLQSDQGTGIIYDSFQDQQEGDEIMEQGTPFQGEMDPIKSEVEENEVAVITDPFEQVKMEMNETEPVYPVALITIKRQSEISGVECFNIHDIDMPAFQTSGKDKREKEENVRDKEEIVNLEGCNNFAFVTMDEAPNEMEPEGINSSSQIVELETDSMHSQGEDFAVHTDTSANNVDKVNDLPMFPNNTQWLVNPPVVSMEEFSNIPIALPCRIKKLNENAESEEEFVLVPSLQENKTESLTTGKQPKSEPSTSKPKSEPVKKQPISNPLIKLPKSEPPTSKQHSKVANTSVRQRRPINILSRPRRPHNVEKMISYNPLHDQILMLPDGQLVLLQNCNIASLFTAEA